MSKVRYNYSPNEPGDGCMIVVAAVVVVLTILLCIYAVPRLWKIEPIAPECTTHSCMYQQPLRSGNGTHD